jgi:hypothetical protein
MGIELRFTDKEITAWGGMGLMKRLLDHLDFDATLQLASKALCQGRLYQHRG